MPFNRDALSPPEDQAPLRGNFTRSVRQCNFMPLKPQNFGAACISQTAPIEPLLARSNLGRDQTDVIDPYRVR